MVLSRLREVIGTGAGWKDIPDICHHSHTHRLSRKHTHTLRSLTAQITENTVTLALFKAKPRLGSDYSHDLRTGMMITLLP